eukprot:CAMPEP_0171247532 /NCGR_PEP_ID=MMETSP0790-20130122/48544_1 /TAXON_ID=2925 /ORGANISM="Alexandrium catenella, Strain OF101" /LENGTH=279 /DNA_ID=CAMNT_0011714945 /DNA_START=27 /DNA_END=862 /DNA_ORIENTATION=-
MVMSGAGCPSCVGQAGTLCEVWRVVLRSASASSSNGLDASLARIADWLPTSSGPPRALSRRARASMEDGLAGVPVGVRAPAACNEEQGEACENVVSSAQSVSPHSSASSPAAVAHVRRRALRVQADHVAAPHRGAGRCLCAAEIAREAGLRLERLQRAVTMGTADLATGIPVAALLGVLFRRVGPTDFVNNFNLHVPHCARVEPRVRAAEALWPRLRGARSPSAPLLRQMAPELAETTDGRAGAHGRHAVPSGRVYRAVRAAREEADGVAPPRRDREAQ